VARGKWILHLKDRRCGSAADVHASLLARTAARCSRLMDWREAPGQKRMAISSADGSARSVRTITKISREWNESAEFARYECFNSELPFYFPL